MTHTGMIIVVFLIIILGIYWAVAIIDEIRGSSKIPNALLVLAIFAFVPIVIDIGNIFYVLVVKKVFDVEYLRHTIIVFKGSLALTAPIPLIGAVKKWKNWEWVNTLTATLLVVIFGFSDLVVDFSDLSEAKSFIFNYEFWVAIGLVGASGTFIVLLTVIINWLRNH